MSKRITCPELVSAGFVNKVFDVDQAADSHTGGGKKKNNNDNTNDEQFLDLVLQEVRDRLSGGHLVGESLLKVKELIRRPARAADESQTMAEVLAGLERFVKGVPQQEFARVASGAKKHKL
jgi:Delta3-Delta2-enoyl-CoA isomerase